MKHKIYLFIIAISSFVVSCKLNPPTIPQLKNPTGKIAVTANADSAKIILDDEFTGKFTPDTLNVSTGEHSINVVKEGYSSTQKKVTVIKDNILTLHFDMEIIQLIKTVLLEDFANVSCIPCVQSNRILESLSDSYNSKSVVKIKYAANFPSPNDPFYLANSNASDTRISDYNIFFTPTIIVDGIEKPIATDSTEIKTAINSRLNETVRFKIDAADSISSGNMNISIDVKTFDISRLNSEQLFLFAVITEKHIHFAAPPGSNGETDFFDVMREILPNQNGLQLSNITSNTMYNYKFNSAVKPAWNLNELNVVIFIQDISTKEIYQAYSIK